MAEKVSTSELYDNESVITQMFLTRKKCDSAVSTAETAASEVKDAVNEVTAAINTVNDAVTKANAASASAEASASTVSGYDIRLNEIEAKAVRKTGETSQIVEGSLQLNGDLTVENEVITDNLNVDTVNASEVNVGASCTVPDTETGTVSQYAANAKRVQADLDAYAPMLRLSDNQTVNGVKTFNEKIISCNINHICPVFNLSSTNLAYKIAVGDSRISVYSEYHALIQIRGTVLYGRFTISSGGTMSYILNDLTTLTANAEAPESISLGWFFDGTDYYVAAKTNTTGNKIVSISIIGDWASGSRQIGFKPSSGTVNISDYDFHWFW